MDPKDMVVVRDVQANFDAPSILAPRRRASVTRRAYLEQFSKQPESDSTGFWRFVRLFCATDAAI